MAELAELDMTQGRVKCPAAPSKKMCISSRLGAGIWRNRENTSSQPEIESGTYRLNFVCFISGESVEMLLKRSNSLVRQDFGNNRAWDAKFLSF